MGITMLALSSFNQCGLATLLLPVWLAKLGQARPFFLMLLIHSQLKLEIGIESTLVISSIERSVSVPGLRESKLHWALIQTISLLILKNRFLVNYQLLTPWKLNSRV